jgi:cytidylate kinase
MPIITIAHAAFSGGGTVAEKVASSLNYRCVDREVLIEASKRYGTLKPSMPKCRDRGHWWERWESLRLYRITLQAAMCEVAQGEKLVYHGRAGQQLFPGIKHVMNVLVVAPIDYRIELARAQKKGMDVETARQYIRELDRVRSRRYRAVFNDDWQDPVNYDLVLNSARFTAEVGAALIVETVRRPEFQPTAESNKTFQDLTTTARVQAALITSAKTRNVVLNVKSDNGRVSISGILADPDLEKEIVRIAKDVPGVTDVITDIEPPPIEYMHP